MLTTSSHTSLYRLIQNGIHHNYKYMGYQEENDEFCFIDEKEKNDPLNTQLINNFSKKIVKIIQDKEIVNQQALSLVLSHEFTNFHIKNHLISRETTEHKVKWFCIKPITELNLKEGLLLLDTIRPTRSISKLKYRNIKQNLHGSGCITKKSITEDSEIPSTSTQTKVKGKVPLACTSLSFEQRKLVQETLKELSRFCSYVNLLLKVNEKAKSNNILVLKRMTLYNEIQNFLKSIGKCSRDISTCYQTYDAKQMNALAQQEKNEKVKRRIELQLNEKPSVTKVSRYMDLGEREILKKTIIDNRQTKMTVSMLYEICKGNGYNHSLNSVSKELKLYAEKKKIDWGKFQEENFVKYDPAQANQYAVDRKKKVISKIKASMTDRSKTEGQKKHLDLNTRKTIKRHLTRYSNSTLSVVDLHRQILKDDKSFSFTYHTIRRELKRYAHHIDIDFNAFLVNSKFKKYDANKANAISKLHK